jgi:spore germination cell wall hydrolase CwlJ-like protein
MFYSQNQNITPAWTVLFAVLFMTLIWQYVNTSVKAYSIEPRQTVQTATATLAKPTMTPEKIKEQKRREAYSKARFLSVVETNDKVHFSKNDLFCMAKNIYHEAGNQSTKGKLAVAQVTINRTRDPKFAGRVCDVVFAKNQFSWTLNRHLRWSHPHDEQWDESVRIARAALQDGFRVKGMEDALYYHANYVNPRWRGLDRLAQIGAHIFYTRDV